MFAGLLLFACYIGFALSGIQFTSFAISLILLGVGWNFYLLAVLLYSQELILWLKSQGPGY